MSRVSDFQFKVVTRILCKVSKARRSTGLLQGTLSPVYKYHPLKLWQRTFSLTRMCGASSEAKVAACKAIERDSNELRDLSLDIWNNPELGFEEHRAHKTLTDFLDRKGFKVEKHYKLETAFKATFSNSDTAPDATNIGVMCEYDALPGIGHACGHNLIAIMGVSISLGIKEAFEKCGLKGRLTVLGCPAEEGGGGKIDLIEAGAFEDMDLAMMAHPSQFNLPRPVYVAMAAVNVKYEGKPSHAASFPWEGVNALDAAVLCYQNVSCMRHQMKPTWRVHGIISNGGLKPNIIPETAELQYYMRAPTSLDLEDLKKKLTGCFEGAATATGCKVSFEFLPKPYDSLMTNEQLINLYVNNGEALGIDFEKDPVRLMKQGGSTDMGNVSKVLPSVHPKYSLDTLAPNHTKEFCDISGREPSHVITLTHAKALAMAAIDVYEDPSLVAMMKEEFKAKMGNGV